MMSSTRLREEFDRIASSGMAAFRKARELMRLSRSLRAARDLRARLAMKQRIEGNPVRSRMLMESVSDLDRLAASARGLAKIYLEMSGRKVGFGYGKAPKGNQWSTASSWRPSDQAGAS